MRPELRVGLALKLENQLHDHNSLLAEIALRLARSPEDVATEGLAFVLRCEAARRRVQHLVEDWMAGPTRTIAVFRSQACAEDESRPDLEGHDQDGVPVVLFENKFWAGLTEAQPAAYLERLRRAGGALCFVAPATRVPFLWTELVDRVREAGGEHLEVCRDEPQLKLAKLSESRVLVLTSWLFLLGEIGNALAESGESSRAADVRQLMGLAVRMDSPDFLPLTAADLSAPTPRHVLQLCQIVDDAVQTLLMHEDASRFVSKKGLKAAAGAGWYGHYLRIHGYGCLLYFTAWWWKDNPGSPIWLRVAGPDWKYPERAELALVTELGRDRCFESRDPDALGVWIPIRVKTGCGLEDVVEEVCEQVLQIAACLAPTADQATDIMPIEQDAENGDVVPQAEPQ